MRCVCVCVWWAGVQQEVHGGLGFGGDIGASQSLDVLLSIHLNDQPAALSTTRWADRCVLPDLRPVHHHTPVAHPAVCRYELFGYEINVYNGSQYRLNSMYAETPDDSLLFQTTESGMQVLQTDFFSEMEQHAKTFIGRCNSIPAFLSTVQLDLFNRQTMMQ